MNENGRTGANVAERPPVWTYGRPPAGMRRRANPPWTRDLEPYEDGALRERFPGATVLEDMAPSSEAESVLYSLARYTVIRILLLAAAGRLSRRALRTEQRVARGHLLLLPSQDWERRTLERLTTACTETVEPVALDLARSCADSAAQRGHRMGAFALYRAVFEISVAREWWDDAARAAWGIRELARSDGAVVSERVWRWRTRVLRERDRRQAAARELAEATSSEGDGGQEAERDAGQAPGQAIGPAAEAARVTRIVQSE